MPVRLFSRAELLSELLPFLIQVYHEAFSQPPYRGVDAAAFADILLRHAERASFTGLVAEEDGAVVGFAYGYTGEPGGWWYDQVRARLPAETAETWLDAPFELAELAVAPRAQGRGLGARLHDELLVLASRSHERAVLSTLDAETPAMRLYRRRGWQVLASHFRFRSGPTYRILGRRLRPIAPAQAAWCRIRPATPDDVEAIWAIAWATWAKTFRDFMSQGLQERLLTSWYSPQALRSAVNRPSQVFLVAEEAGAPCGLLQMGLVRPETAEIFRIGVLPAYQRAGLGTRLLRRGLEALRAHHRIVAVEVTVEAQNAPAQAFCAAQGFRRIGRETLEVAPGEELERFRYRLEPA